MQGDELIRRQALATLRAREAVGRTLTAAERTLLVELAHASRELPVGLVVEATRDDPIGRVWVERTRQDKANARKGQPDGFEVEAA